MYLNSYTDSGEWVQYEIKWTEKGKLLLSNKQYEQPIKVPDPSKSTPHKIRYLQGKLMSYVLGESPFYLIRANSICFENDPFEKKLESGKILCARATKNGLILIHRRRNQGHFLMKYTHDGREEKEESLDDFPWEYAFQKYARWHSFNQPSRMHSLNDFSTQNLPLGHSMDDENGKEYTFYYFERESLLLNRGPEDGMDFINKKEFYLNIFSSDKQIKFRRLSLSEWDGFIVQNKESAYPRMKGISFWISQSRIQKESELKINLESRD
jgi:hypothetical protein